MAVDKDQVYDVRPAGKRGAGKAGGRRDLKSWARKNRTQLMVGGASAVVLLALVAKRRASSAASGAGSANPTRVVPPGSSYGDPQDFRGAAGAGVYDSTASDVYNSLQPQIEQVQRSIEALIGLSPGTPVEPVINTPAPAPKPAPAPTSPSSSYKPPAPAPAPTVVRKPTPTPVRRSPVAPLPRIIDRPTAYNPPPLAPAPTYRVDNPYRPPSHTNPILRPGDAPSPGNGPRPGGTLAQIAADQAKYIPTAPNPRSLGHVPTPAPRTGVFKRIGRRR